MDRLDWAVEEASHGRKNPPVKLIQVSIFTIRLVLLSIKNTVLLDYFYS